MPLPEQENPFETLSIKEFLPTIRDAKHYLNLLSQDIKSYLGKEDFKNLVWSKWYLVELLKHCDSYLYTQLKSTPARWLDTSKKVCKNWEFVVPRQEWIEAQDKDIKRILNPCSATRLHHSDHSTLPIPYTISVISLHLCHRIFSLAKVPLTSHSYLFWS